MGRALNAFLLLVVSAASNAAAYPSNPIDRGLILPAGIGEVSLGPAWFSGNERIDTEADWNLHYALSENFEIARVGLRYRFFHGDGIQLAASLQNYGLGYSETDGGFHHTVALFETKQRIRSWIAVHYAFGVFWSSSHEKDGNTSERRFSIGPIFRLSEGSALAFEVSYRDFSGFETQSSGMIETAFTQNLSANWDIVAEVAVSGFNEAVDSIIFNESYDQAFTLRVNWRF